MHADPRAAAFVGTAWALAALLGACSGPPRADLGPPAAAPRFPHETLLLAGAGFAPELSGFRAVRGEWTPRGWRLCPAEGGEAALASPVYERIPFRELVASWNVASPPGAGFVVELRVGAAGGAPLSPWLEVGEWGAVPERERATSCADGAIEVDLFRAERAFARFQLRVRAFGAGELRVERLAACLSDVGAARAGEPASSGEGVPAPLELALAPRSQRDEDPAIAGRICSPTSLAMVLAYHGVELPTAEVAARAYDPRHDLYGNWPRNVQAAFELGVAGYVTRFARWREVAAELAAGRPLVISIRAGEGELAGAPYERTGGHLLVLRGFDARGDCLVLDPAGPDRSGVARTYARADLERVWLAKGGVAYVLLGSSP